MKVLVTGGAGFIGANLCRQLAERYEHEVVVLDDLSTGRRANLSGVEVDLRVGSVLDPDMLAAACHGVDSIVHLAAAPSVPRSIESPRHCHDTNVTGTVAVLEAARATAAHIVVASSSSVYGRNPVLPKTEDLVCQPTSPYGASKLAAESYCAAYRCSFGLPAIAFRFFNVFGPLQDPNHDYAAVIPAFVHNALRRRPLTIYGDGTQTRDFTFVDSVVDVLAQAVERRVTSQSPVNLAFGTRTTLNDMIGMLAGILGRALDIRYQQARIGDIEHSQASSTSLHALFPGIQAVPLRRGLLSTVGWMEQDIAACLATQEVRA